MTSRHPCSLLVLGCVVTLLLSAVHSQVSWSPCSTIAYPYPFSTVVAPKITTECTNTDTWNGEKILFAKRYKAEQSLGTVFVFGNAMTSNLLRSEMVAIQLYQALGQSYDIVLPYTDSKEFETIVSRSIQLVRAIRTNTVNHAHGTRFGGAVVDRITQVEPTLFSSVTLDSPCFGTNCDFNRSLSQFNDAIYYVIEKCKQSKGMCGEKIRQELNTTQDNLSPESCTDANDMADPMMLFEPYMRPMYFVLLYRSIRCNVDDRKALKKILTEMGNPYNTERRVDYDRFARGLKYNTTATSSCGYATNNYNGSILILDVTQSPLMSYTCMIDYAGQFENGRHIRFPGEIGFVLSPYNPVAENFTVSNCGFDIIVQFIKNPNVATLNISCMDTVKSYSTEVHPLMNSFFGVDNVYEQPLLGNENIAISVLFIIVNIVALVLAFTTAILVILFRKEQPVRSRGFTPYFGLIAAMFTSALFVAETIQQLYYIYPHTNPWTETISGVLDKLLVALQAIQLLRYLIMKRVYARYALGQHYNTRLFKVLTSRITAGIVTLIVIVVYLIPSIVVVSLELSKALRAKESAPESLKSLIATEIPTSAVLSCIVVPVLILVFVDIWYSAKCNIRRYFTVGDPLYFTWEAAVFVPAVFFVNMQSIFLYIEYDQKLAPFVFADQWLSGPLTFSGVHLTGIIMSVLYVYFVIPTFGGIAVTIVLLRKLRGKDKNKKQDHALDISLINDIDDGELMYATIEDPEGYQVFFDYAKQEFSLENLLAFSTLNQILEAMEEEREDAMDLAIAFQNKFLKEDSLTELNVVAMNKSRYNNMLHSGVLDKDIIVIIRSEIEGNLLDTFDRLLHTVEYKTYWNSKKKEGVAHYVSENMK